MKINRKTFGMIALIAEFAAFVNFAVLTVWLCYALTHRTPIPAEKQLDNDFVPYFLLFLLFAGTCAFGLAFVIHFSVRRMKNSKEKRAAAARLP